MEESQVGEVPGAEVAVQKPQKERGGVYVAQSELPRLYPVIKKSKCKSSTRNKRNEKRLA